LLRIGSAGICRELPTFIDFSLQSAITYGTPIFGSFRLIPTRNLTASGLETHGHFVTDSSSVYTHASVSDEEK